MQSIPTSGACDWESFSIDDIQYLAVANAYDDTSHSVDSKVYKWDLATSSFVETQSIPTIGASGLAAFSLDGVQHLAVANRVNGSNYNLVSKIYRWHDASSSFGELQNIPTNGADGLAAFSMEGVQYLAVANSFDGTSHSQDSKVYKWDDARGSFMEIQSIPTNKAWGWAAFSMHGISKLRNLLRACLRNSLNVPDFPKHCLRRLAKSFDGLGTCWQQGCCWSPGT